MVRKLHKDNKGFTIIEVLIVLAIAGLIMLIVFLAVPALQRNSRNTERRNEASRLLTAANEFVTNNNSTAFTTTAHAQQIHQAAGVTSLAQPTIGGTGNLALNATRLVYGGRCNASVAESGGTGRQIALQFGLEGGGSNVVQACITM